MIEEYIETLRPEVLKLFKDESSGHDITHLERTKNLALMLQKAEGGDEVVIGIAAFLHDVHRIMQNETGQFVSPKESLNIVSKILEVVDITKEQEEQILYSIEYHEVYNWNNPDNKENDINTLILQDADNLDAIGTIGIARSIAYCSAHGVPMYNSNVPLENDEDYAEENGDDASMIHHVYHKLVRLCENMNTNTAKELAKERTKVMMDFAEEFLLEWNGEK